MMLSAGQVAEHAVRPAAGLRERLRLRQSLPFPPANPAAGQSQAGGYPQGWATSLPASAYISPWFPSVSSPIM
jgi:hypothetical protein